MQTRPDRARGILLFPLLALFFAAFLLSLSHGGVIAEDAVPPESNEQAIRRVELLQSLGIPAWHAQGRRGRGWKIAVLDSGFHGYQSHLGKALPKTVTIHSFRFDGNLEAKESQHGILCAEVIHALAPEAEILLANWEPENPRQFLAAVHWARQQGARILSCSLIMPTWSDYEGHGRIHEELTRLLGSSQGHGDALFFASAGNTAQRHWSGPFVDGGEGYHVWMREENGVCQDNSIRPWGHERVSVELCCPLASAYALQVFDKKTGNLVGQSATAESGGTWNAVVGFQPEPGHEYRVRVRGLGQTQGTFHLVVLGGGLWHSSPAASIPFPGDGAEVVAVGAVDRTGQRLAYSSCGPKDGAMKPDLVATVPFPSSWRARPFAGTSAAAPQASAVAALLWSRHSDWNAGQLRAALHHAARSCPARSALWEIGHGLLRLPAPTASVSHSLGLMP